MPQDTAFSASASCTASIGQPRCVFVYGTLRRGGSNDITKLHPAPRWVGPAQVAGVLYHLGTYPGMALGGAQWVKGEVYAITPELEEVLDEIEGLGGDCPSDEYTKREVTVHLRAPIEGDGDRGPRALLSCLAYEINPRCLGSARLIAHGDWMTAV